MEQRSAATNETARAMTIRRATLGDLEAIAEMANAAYRKSEGHVFATTVRTQRDDLAQHLDGLMVGEIDGRIAGCVHFETGGDVAHFGLLATSVARHGSGIGSMLIEHVEQLARGAGYDVMRIETVKEAGLVSFYERRGYVVTGETPGQLWNGGRDWGAVIDWHMVDMEKALR